MYPVLFKVGGFVVSSYSVMLLIAFLTAYYLSAREFRRKGLDDSLRDYFLIACVVGGLVGAKILFLVENVTLREFTDDPFRYLSSGLTFLGGFIGALILIWIVARVNSLSFLYVCDTISPLVVLSYAIGRIGCFLVGDDYGPPSDLPWAMAFPKGSPPTTERVHPTQIYDFLVLTILFAFLWRIRKKQMPTGWLFGLTLFLLGVERFVIEYWRVTTPSFIPGVSVAQLMSLFVAAAGAILMFTRSSRLG